MLVEVWALKAIPMETNMLLERGGKVNLIIKSQRTWLNCVLVFCIKVKLASNETGYIAEIYF